MAWGYWLKLLVVDLSAKSVWVENLSEQFCRDYLGGAGFGTKLLFDQVKPGTDPLSDENILIFATGPYQGTTVPGSGKWAVVSKSPLTKTFAVATAGAEWGNRFKKTGYDAVCIKGSSDRPVYLSIGDDKVTIQDASHIWGLDAVAATQKLKAQMPEHTSVAAIGPAGENLVSIAAIVADEHSIAGRCGMGAVMGSKKLKAIAVKGNQEIPVFKPQKLKELSRNTFKMLSNNARETFQKHGTAILVSSCEAVGDLPIKNWQEEVWTEKAGKIGAPVYTQKLNAKSWPCWSCPIGCHRKISFTTRKGVPFEGAGPEYETLGMLGSCCLVDDLEAICLANDICTRLGMDTISAGSFVAFAMECFEKGCLTEQDIGYKLDWGNPEALIRLVTEIGQNTGFGAIFSGGILPAAEKVGKDSRQYAIQVKGLDLPAHDPRSYFSLAVNYATGTRGGCHLRGFPHIGESGMTVPEIGITKAPERFSMEGQAYLTIVFQDLAAVLDSLVCCLFMQCCGMDLTITNDILNAITGWELSPEELMEIGERISNLQRVINVGDGYDRRSDQLPKRMFEPALKGFRANKAPFNLESTLDEYYKLRGWDESGIPTEHKKEALKLV
ncbi:aldehyde ferredoxin oxidoreductase family protein [Candidatus Formimonas warabiya]|uniref:Aldehyde ferredoxin oxidoreductase N-terminal domain-containing protein n=1 Tax=Formimonas warabiya TaxID=1761012 RepID=A0A3G1KX85_FORW1|nr:aldehyde ferredoxin oxidoreductase family protein [Candidatus Formimonas warabiya]ATW27051.1 hypothetical protein DCMF_21845 [Candidatus Formimonas warabiya]